MTASQFSDLQEALLFIFGPALQWLATAMIAGGIIIAFYVLWLGFVRWTTFTAEEQ